MPTYRILVRTSTYENRWVTADDLSGAESLAMAGEYDDVETLESDVEEIVETQCFGDPVT